YLFGDLAARATSTTLRGTWTFSPVLTLQAYAQGFVATGRFGPFFTAAAAGPRPRILLSDLQPAAAPSESPDFKDANLNLNIVLRWEYQPGSALYVVYTRAQAVGSLTPGLGPDQPDLG